MYELSKCTRKKNIRLLHVHSMYSRHIARPRGVLPFTRNESKDLEK